MDDSGAQIWKVIKIAMAEKSIEQLPFGTITTRHQVTKVREFVTFVTHVYLKWWISCKKAVDAPCNNLQLFKRILQFDLVNTDASQSAIPAFSNHFWYMTAEMVPLALFSSLVPLVERQALGDALLKVQLSTPLQSPQQRFGSGWGKPQFPSSINLSTLLTWFTMFRLQIYKSFLHLPIAE